MRRVGILVVLLFCCLPIQAQKISEKVAGMEKFPGFFTFYWDAKAGKIWLEIDKWNTEFLYVESLPAGIGSNDIGLDRVNSATVRLSVSIAPGRAFCWWRRTTVFAPPVITPMNVWP